MKEVLLALNAIEANGVISRYAIGDAVGASFYAEAVSTEDVDAFVFLSPSPGGLILLTPIYEALVGQGGVVEGEYVRFGAWPLQILPAYKLLVEEALQQAVATEFDGVPTRVLPAEYLCAIALDTGRAKDYLRVASFLEQAAVDTGALEALVQRFELGPRWARVPKPQGSPNEKA